MIQLPAPLCWRSGKLPLREGPGRMEQQVWQRRRWLFPAAQTPLAPLLSQQQLRQPAWLSRAASPQQLPLLLVPTRAATSDRPHSLSLPRLVQLCPPGTLWDEGEMLSWCQNVPPAPDSHIKLPRINPFAIPAGLHSGNLGFRSAASATENILIFD